MKKKALILPLALTLLVAFSGCEKATEQTSVETSPDASVIEITSYPMNDVEEGQEATGSETDSGSTDVNDTSDIFGDKTEKQYLNTYFDISFDMPENWVNAQEEGQDTNDTNKTVEDNSYIDLYAIDVNTGSSVICAIAKTNMYTGQGIEDINTETILDFAKEEVVTQFESQGVTEVTTEIVDISLCGKITKALKIASKVNEMDIKQYTTYIVNGDYVLGISVSTLSGDPEPILEYFSTAN